MLGVCPMLMVLNNVLLNKLCQLRSRHWPGKGAQQVPKPNANYSALACKVSTSPKTGLKTSK